MQEKSSTIGLFSIQSFLTSLLASFALTFILLALLAFLLLKLDVSASFIQVGIITTYLLSNFLGGLILGKSKKSRKFLWGIGAGIIYYAILAIVSFVLAKTGGMQLTNMVMVLLLCALGGMLGGMVS